MGFWGACVQSLFSQPCTIFVDVEYNIIIIDMTVLRMAGNKFVRKILGMEECTNYEKLLEMQ